MKKLPRTILMFLFAAALAFSAAPPLSASAYGDMWEPADPSGTGKSLTQACTLPVTVTEMYDEAYEVFRLVNIERRNEGLDELELDAELMDVAMLRAAEQPLLFGHTRPDGEKWYTADRRLNGENAAAGQSSARAVVASWMTSQGHRENILGDGYRSIGIGAVRSGDICYWTQVFSMDDVSSPAPSTPAKATREVTQKVRVSPQYCSGEICGVLGGGDAALNAGQSTELSLRFSGSWGRADLANGRLSFKTSDSNVLQIDRNGTVTGVSSGSATVEVYTKDEPAVLIWSRSVKVSGGGNYGASFTLGDVNMDGKINSQDARLALRAAAKTETLSERQALLADVNEDGYLRAADARAILRISAKLDPKPGKQISA